VAAAARKVVAALPASLVEVNLNCGCPSKAVAGHYASGASLMRSPARVQAIAAAVRAAVPTAVDVTVKMRLGVDDHDSFEQLVEFVRIVSAPPACVTRFIVHARKAILGLTTDENRSVPPLRWDWVYRLCRAFPDLSFELNGGVQTLDEAESLLARGGIAGVMVGRAARDDPLGVLADADRRIYGCTPKAEKTLRAVAAAYSEYAGRLWDTHAAAAEASEEVRGRPHERRELRERLYRPVLGLFARYPEARQRLEKALERKSGISKALKAALLVFQPDQLDIELQGVETQMRGGSEPPKDSVLGKCSSVALLAA